MNEHFSFSHNLTIYRGERKGRILQPQQDTVGGTVNMIFRRNAGRLPVLFILSILLAGLVSSCAEDTAAPTPGDPEPGVWVWQSPSPQGNSLQSIFLVDRNVAYAVGAVGTIIRTTDGGETWTSEKSHTSASLNDIAFTSTGIGVAVGDA